MSAVRSHERTHVTTRFLLALLLSVVTLARCGSGSSVKLEATATDSFFGAFSFSYATGWEAPLLDAPPGAHTYGWLEFVPPNESHDDVYVLYSRDYEGLPTFWCSLDATLSDGHSFKDWGNCVADAMKRNGGFSNVSHRQANGGKIQIVEAVQGDRHEMWAFVYTTSFTGWRTLGALTFSATPAKFDQYRPYADAMMSSFRAKST